MSTLGESLARGWKLHQAGDSASAQKVYQEILRLEPKNATAWCYVGMLYHDQHRLGEAVGAYRQAIRIEPNFPVAFNNLGNTLRLQGRLEEAMASFDEALRLRPDYLNAYKNKGTTLFWQGNLSQSLECYRQVLEYAPEDAESHKNMGVILLLLGRFDDGWPEYAWRWKTGQTSLPPYREPLWDGSSLHGKTILLTAEQGLGDTIHFIRYASVLKQRYECRVMAACQRALLPVLSTCPGIDQLIDQRETPPSFDCFCPLLNVPAVLGDVLETFPGRTPYLEADPELTRQWKQKLHHLGGVKIGLAWQGNPNYPADHLRSFPLAELVPLAKLAGVHLISLQKKYGLDQLRGALGPLDIVDLGDGLDETNGPFMDTAAVIKNLDLVIPAIGFPTRRMRSSELCPLTCSVYMSPSRRRLLDFGPLRVPTTVGGDSHAFSYCESVCGGEREATRDKPVASMRAPASGPCNGTREPLPSFFCFRRWKEWHKRNGF